MIHMCGNVTVVPANNMHNRYIFISSTEERIHKNLRVLWEGTRNCLVMIVSLENQLSCSKL